MTPQLGTTYKMLFVVSSAVSVYRYHH